GEPAGAGGIGEEGGFVHPGLECAAAPGAVDDADGRIQRAVQGDGEVAGDGAEFAGAFRGGGRPAAVGGGEGDGGGVALDVEVADEREAGGGDFFPGIGGVAEGPFHVGLAGGEPDLADEHVAHDDGVFPAHDEFARRSGGGQRRQRHAPAPVGRGGGGGALPG